MSDHDDEQADFNAETASVALELLEMARRSHHLPGGLDMVEAWENSSTNNPLVVLGACGRVIEAAVALGADTTNPEAFDGRIGVLRSTFVALLGRN